MRSIITVLRGFFAAVIRRRGLPSVSVPELPAPSAEPSPFEARLASAGFLVWNRDEVKIRGEYPERLIGQLVACDRWPSTHIHNSEVPYRCASCDSYEKMYGIGEVVKRQPIGGASDTGRATMLLIGVICSVCGYVVGAGWYEQQYQQDWHDHARLRELMGHRRNFLEQLDHLERLQGAPQHERRLRLLEAELETLDVRRSLLLSEKRGLEENLGLLRGDPNRDRFALPAARLEDPPDNRAKAMPALTGSD